MHTYKEIKKKHYVWEFNGINRLDLRRMGGKQMERKLEEKQPHTPKSPRAGHWQNRVSAVPAQPCLPETTQPPPQLQDGTKLICRASVANQEYKSVSFILMY